MADRYLLESGAPDGYLLEDGSGVLLIDFPLWTPALLGSKLKAWLKADELAGSGGSDVSTWPDASGNANDAVSVGNNPQLQAAALNGLNTLRFVAANIDALNLPSGIVSAFTEGSIFFVVKPTSEGFAGHGSPIGDFGTSGSPDVYGWSDGHVYNGFLSTTRPDCGDPGTIAAWHIASFQSKANDWRYAFNGVDFYTTGTNTVGAAAGIPRIGASTTLHFDGDLAEIAICNEFLTTDERQKLEGYYAHKWGLTAGLDAGHPYKTEPPYDVPFAGAVAMATETDTALALAAVGVRAVGLATQANTALPLGIARPVGMSAESDTALALGAKVVRAAGMSTETDTALGRGIAVGLGRASETGNALGLGAKQIRALGLATETDSPQGLAAKLIRTIGIGIETDAALRLGIALPPGIAVETDTSLALSRKLVRPVELAGETDTAFALVAGGAAIPVGLASETDTAVGLVARLIRSNGIALETDVALALALVATAGGRPKAWDGSQWGLKPAKVWTGSAWVEKPVKVWDGSQWILG